MPDPSPSLLQLAATLGLSRSSLEERLRVLAIGPPERQRLAAVGARLGGERAALLDRFYAQLRRSPSAAVLLADEAVVARLKSHQTAYLQDLLTAELEWDHALRCLQIGVVHHRVRLLPQWFVAAYAHLLCDHVPLLLREASSPEEGVELVVTLVKSALCDASIALDGYAMTAENAIRDEAMAPAPVRPEAQGAQAPAQATEPPVISRMRVGSDSASERCVFLGIDADVLQALREVAPAVEEALPETVAAFYAMVAEWEQAEPLVPPGAVERLSRSLAAYWRELVAADFGRTYAASRTLVGLVHERIGLSSPRYLVGLATQLAVLIRRVARATPDPARSISALLRAVFFDVSYVLQAYVEARAEAVLRSEGFASELLAGFAAGVAVVDPRLRVQSVNPALLRLLGVDAGLVRHAPLEELLPVPRVLDLVRSAWQHPASRPVATFERNGRRFRATALRLARGPSGGGGLVALVLDEITGFVEAHSEAQRTEQRFGDLIDAVQAFAWEADDETFTPSLVSRSALEVTGHRDVGLLGRDQALTRLLPEPDRAAFVARCRAIRPGEKASIRHRLIRADGSIAWIRSDVARLQRQGASWLCGVSIDVTAAHLEDERRLEALGRFAGGAAHEYNNRLTVVMTNLSMLLADAPLRPAHAEMLREARTAAEQSAALTRQMLGYAQRQVLRPRALVLNEVVDAARPALLRLLGSDVALDLDLALDLWPCYVDKAEVEAMLLGLAANARDAMPRGGRLRLVTRNVQAASAPAPGTPPARDFVEVSLEDDGEGMAPAVQARAFDPFFTTRLNATGLGLSIVRGFVTQSGGEVTLDTGEGAGTRVRVLFPRLEAAPEPSAVAPADDRPFALLVDDEALLRQAMKRLADRAGLAHLAVGTVAEALEVIRSRRVDVLVTDVVLANGESGAKLARLARAQRTDLPVVFVSGYTRGELALERLEDGEWFLPKPFDIDEFVAALETAVAWRREAVRQRRS